MSRIDTTTATLDMVSASGTFNLLNQLSELVIYENIFRPALTAKLILTEGHNLPQKLPIVGEETVHIDFGTRDFKGQTIRINPPPLHINSLTDREIIKPKAQVLALELVSEKFMSNSHATISKSYKDKKIKVKHEH